MKSFFRFDSSPSAQIGSRRGYRLRAARIALFLLPLACGVAAAQNTTISGTVYDPRTTNGLPLPNVLVYATTGPVAPLPAGVQCLTYQAPTSVVSYAYTAVDGTFTLPNIPENRELYDRDSSGQVAAPVSEHTGLERRRLPGLRCTCRRITRRATFP